MHALRFKELCRLPDAPDGYSLVTKSVAGDASLLFLYVQKEGENAVRERYPSGIGTFPRSRMTSSKRFQLLRIRADQIEAIELPEFDITFPRVDVFPNGKVLVV